MEKAGASPPSHSSASGSSPPSLKSQSRAGLGEPVAPGKAVVGAVPGGRSRGTAEGRASELGSARAGGSVALVEGQGEGPKRSSEMVMRSESRGAGSAVASLSGVLGRGSSSWRGNTEEAEVGGGPGSAQGPQGLSREGSVSGRTSEVAVG